MKEEELAYSKLVLRTMVSKKTVSVLNHKTT